MKEDWMKDALDDVVISINFLNIIIKSSILTSENIIKFMIKQYVLKVNMYIQSGNQLNLF